MKRYVFIAATVLISVCTTVHQGWAADQSDQVFEDGVVGGVLGGLVGGFLDNDKGNRIHASEARYHHRSCNSGDVYFAKARKARDLDDRLTFIEQGIKHCPDNPAAHNDLGVALMLWGDMPAARSHFNRALTLDRDYNPARINISRLPHKTVEKKAEPGAGKRDAGRIGHRPSQEALIKHQSSRKEYLERLKRRQIRQDKIIEQNKAYD